MTATIVLLSIYFISLLVVLFHLYSEEDYAKNGLKLSTLCFALFLLLVPYVNTVVAGSLLVMYLLDGVNFSRIVIKPWRKDTRYDRFR